MCKAIAVYGTLRYGGSANGLMRGMKYLGRDEVYGTLFSLGSFPGVSLGSEDNPDEKVVVDVYELPKEHERVLLGNIDRYEGYYPNAPDQSLYTRVKTLTVEGNLEVWVYEYNHTFSPSAIVGSGDWFDVD